MVFPFNSDWNSLAFEEYKCSRVAQALAAGNLKVKDEELNSEKPDEKNGQEEIAGDEALDDEEHIEQPFDSLVKKHRKEDVSEDACDDDSENEQRNKQIGDKEVKYERVHYADKEREVLAKLGIFQEDLSVGLGAGLMEPPIEPQDSPHEPDTYDVKWMSRGRKVYMSAKHKIDKDRLLELSRRFKEEEFVADELLEMLNWRPDATGYEGSEKMRAQEELNRLSLEKLFDEYPAEYGLATVLHKKLPDVKNRLLLEEFFQFSQLPNQAEVVFLATYTKDTQGLISEWFEKKEESVRILSITKNGIGRDSPLAIASRKRRLETAYPPKGPKKTNGFT